jgi:hypothetical protein
LGRSGKAALRIKRCSTKKQKGAIVMTIVVCKAADFQVANEGTYLATLVKVVDLGRVKTTFGEKDCARLIWAITDGGKEMTIFQRVTKSLHPKSQLGRITRVLMGGLPDADFDIELLVGRKAMIVIVHRESDGNTYANVTVVFSPNGDGHGKQISPDKVNNATNVHGVDITDADIPKFERPEHQQR